MRTSWAMLCGVLIGRWFERLVDRCLPADSRLEALQGNLHAPSDRSTKVRTTWKGWRFCGGRWLRVLLAYDRPGVVVRAPKQTSLPMSWRWILLRCIIQKMSPTKSFAVALRASVACYIQYPGCSISI